MSNTPAAPAAFVPYTDFVNALAKPGSAILESLTPEKCHLWHMASCLPSEAGELFDAVKKYVIYGKEFDKANVLEEAGDILFYLTATLDACGYTVADAVDANRKKLGVRYASLTYSDAAAQERADKSHPSNHPSRKFMGMQPKEFNPEELLKDAKP